MEPIKRLINLPEKKTFFLFGPRQTGKSTLLLEKIKGKRSLTYDLLDSETFRRISARPELLRAELSAVLEQRAITHILIDEVQRVPALLAEIHALIEANKQISFMISGSSARKLKRTQADMLGGRAWTFHLYPFTFHELGPLFNLDRALCFGTLPAVYLAPTDTDRIEILKSYVDTYIHEEIEIEAQLRNVGNFLRFLPMVASENGAQANFLNISREISISHNTVRTYYQILEDTLLGFFLFPYVKSVRKRISRHPKFYLFDCGVVRALLKKSSAPLMPESEEYGRAFEHFLICEIQRLNEYLRLDLDISFYRTESGVEVDCVLQFPSGDVWAVEIKSTRNPHLSHCAGLRSFSESFPKAYCFLVCRASRTATIGTFTAWPWQEFLQKIAALKR
ncbi:MAG: AAA family ATPase [Chitinivibrionales bacterium]|nr:AAA family ATPase [Chitinivibrionales bacterium]